MPLTMTIAAVVILAVLIAVIMRQPDDFKVSRTAVIDAPVAVVFDHVNNLHKWQTWSPWAKADPEAKATFAGPDEGVGASLHWEGQKTGVGTMTNVESRMSEYVEFKLEFEKPFKATNKAYLTFTPQGDKTSVTWTMEGKNNFMSKTMSLFMNCEKMVGGQFDDGFRNLNDVVARAQ